MTATRAGRRRTAGLAVVLAAGLALSGCGHARPELEPGRAAAFQREVFAITQAVAAGQFDTAQAGVQRLRTALDLAADDGQVSAPRFRVIDTALDQVTTELATAVQQRDAELAAAEQAAADQAAAQQAADQAAAAQTGTQTAPSAGGTGGGSGSGGKGNGKGKGKG
ncbi:MAG TPA: mucin-associated surface protein [Actinotalea sp.]